MTRPERVERARGKRSAISPALRGPSLGVAFGAGLLQLFQSKKVRGDAFLEAGHGSMLPRGWETPPSVVSDAIDPIRSTMPATRPRWPRSYTRRSGVASIPKS